MGTIPIYSRVSSVGKIQISPKQRHQTYSSGYRDVSHQMIRSNNIQNEVVFASSVYRSPSPSWSSGDGCKRPILSPPPSQFLMTQGVVSGPAQIFFRSRFLNLGPRGPFT